MRIIEDVKLDFKDVLIQPKRSTLESRKDVLLSRDFKFKHSGKVWSGVPLIAANMDGVGTWAMAKVLNKHRVLTALAKSYTYTDWLDHRHSDELPNAMLSTGIGSSDLQKVNAVLDSVAVDFLCVDVANGYTESFIRTIRELRGRWPKLTIIAGNVVTPEITEELILSGADIVKVGIGPGSVCTTRKQTGVGYPQLSAVIECADAAHGLGGHIIADGGCTCPGDIAKAFGGGADFVMLGGMLAGHDEGGGTKITKYFNPNGEQFITGYDGSGVPSWEWSATQRDFIQFYGMSSATAMEKHHGGVAEYRSSEGKTVEVPYRGGVDATILDILGGLRSTCTYVGAQRIKELPKRTTFIRVNQQLNNIFGG